MEDAYVLQLSNRKFSELYLCSCGYSKCEPLHSFGPAVRPDYLIHYILKGKGRYCIGDTTYCLEAGQGFLIEPNVLTFYQADVDEPWEYLWLGFNGTNVREYLRDIGLSSGQPIYRSDHASELKEGGEAHIVYEDGTRRDAACIGGMLSMLDGTCHLLATTWEWKEDIDEDRANAAKKRAEEVLSKSGLSDREYKRAEAKLHRALVRLSVKK